MPDRKPRVYHCANATLKVDGKEIPLRDFDRQPQEGTPVGLKTGVFVCTGLLEIPQWALDSMFEHAVARARALRHFREKNPSHANGGDCWWQDADGRWCVAIVRGAREDNIEWGE